MTSRLYDRAQWKRRRAAFLAAHPLCRFCEAAGRTTLATVVAVRRIGNVSLTTDA